MKKKLSILAVLVLAITVTAYSVSGTYAKYTTTKSGSDNARVAKWGINVTNTAEVFSSSYTNGTATDVASGDATDVIAPGTTGEYTFSLTGTPEVNYTLAVTGDVVINNDIEGALAGKLKFYIDDKTEHAYTAADLIDGINALYSGKVYAANTSAAGNHKITWVWEFAGDDATDTALGNAAAEGAKIPKVELTVNITATQTEEAAN